MLSRKACSLLACRIEGALVFVRNQWSLCRDPLCLLLSQSLNTPICIERELGRSKGLNSVGYVLNLSRETAASAERPSLQQETGFSTCLSCGGC